MAQIIGAVACSHTPTIGFAFDRNKQHDPVWAPIFEAFAPVQQWLASKKPDVLFFIYNDHVTSFFFDHYSAFALGVGERYAVADEGGGARDLPPIEGHPALARTSASSLMADEFDMSFFQDQRARPRLLLAAVDAVAARAGVAGARSCRCRSACCSSRFRRARRCYKLGQSLRRAIESYPEDLQGGDRRHRRPLAPGARRARGLQQHAVGHAVPRADRERPGAPDRDDASPNTPSSAASKAPKSSCGW